MPRRYMVDEYPVDEPTRYVHGAVDRFLRKAEARATIRGPAYRLARIEVSRDVRDDLREDLARSGYVSMKPDTWHDADVFLGQPGIVRLWWATP